MTACSLGPVSDGGASGGAKPAHQADKLLVPPDELTFTVVTADNQQPLGKRFWLTGNSELQTQTAVPLSSGDVTVEHSSHIRDFADRLSRLSANQAVVYGVPATAIARVVTQARLREMSPEERKGCIARDREHLQFAQAPGIMMLDFDVSGAPPQLLEAVGSPDHVRALVLRAVPELAAAPMLWRPSSSSYLYDGLRQIHGLRGQRLYGPAPLATH